jgi:TPP-dependent pyruvate/acetoin dehydrogenase alpha subunit
MTIFAQPEDAAIENFKTMSLIRAVEERCETLFRDAKVKGSMHLYIGQEAVATGVCSKMQPGDSLSFTYRSHGWAIAGGISPEALLAECFGRVDGCAGGRGGSKHLGDWSKRILPSTAIVGAGAPLAAGIALADKLQGSKRVSVSAFGEGATNQGVVHEAMAIASLWRLPIVFVCENNQYSELTPSHEILPVVDLRDRGRGHGMVSEICDGMDVDAVAEAAATALDRARAGDGPTFLVADTYRYCGHMTGDPQKYRSQEEVAQWKARDPIIQQRDRLLAGGTAADVLHKIEEEVRHRVEVAEAFADKSPEPLLSDLWSGVHSWAKATR